MKKALVAVVAALGITAISSSVALACSIPVFRYALQFWDPGPYELLVFHRGSLDPAAEAKIGKLEAIEPGVGGNLIVRRIDLDEIAKVESPRASDDEAGDDAAIGSGEGGPGEDGSGEGDAENSLVTLWKERAGSVVPSVVVRYPGRFRPGRPFASMPLAKFDPDAWLQSPARKTISQRLTRGESAVWVFLESGDEKKDRDAAERLDRHLAEAKKELRLPEQAPEDQELFRGGLAVETELRLAFSVVRVSRKDPAEAPLVAMLLETEDDLKDYDEPMAFAVFGRGRALPALVGRGINRDMVLDQAAFLTGPCSCQVKEQNPGVDVLIAADWQTLLMKARLEAGGEGDDSGALARALADEPEATPDASPASASPTGTTTAGRPEDASPSANTPTPTATLVRTAEGSASAAESATSTARTAAAPEQGDDSEANATENNGQLRKVLYAVGMVIVALIFGVILLRGRGQHR